MLQGSNVSKWQLESQVIIQAGAAALLTIASGSMLLLYFFLDKAFFIILVRLHSILTGVRAACLSRLMPCSLLMPVDRFCTLRVCLYIELQCQHPAVNPPLLTHGLNLDGIFKRHVSRTKYLSLSRCMQVVKMFHVNRVLCRLDCSAWVLFKR